MSLYEKIYNVMNESEGLEKDLVVGSGSNSYKAIGEKEVLNMLKPLFKKNKLIVFPVDGDITETNAVWEAEYNGKKDTKTRNVTQIKVKFKIVDVETGESEYLMGFGNGADSQDKGSGKAFTYAFKTMLSKTFMLFSGEDTDNTHSDDMGKPEHHKLDSTLPKPNNPPPQGKPLKPDSGATGQPFELEKRATVIYFHFTGNKESQLNWSKEQYKEQLKQWKESGSISTDYGKKWTLQDIEWLECQMSELPF